MCGKAPFWYTGKWKLVDTGSIRVCLSSVDPNNDSRWWEEWKQKQQRLLLFPPLFISEIVAFSSSQMWHYAPLVLLPFRQSKNGLKILYELTKVTKHCKPPTKILNRTSVLRSPTLIWTLGLAYPMLVAFLCAKMESNL